MGPKDRVVGHPAVAMALAVQKRYRLDAADQLAAAISFSPASADASASCRRWSGWVSSLLLFYLAGRLYLYGAELSAVLAERRHGPLKGPPTRRVDRGGRGARWRRSRRG